jgi:hypothetical protein
MGWVQWVGRLMSTRPLRTLTQPLLRENMHIRQHPTSHSIPTDPYSGLVLLYFKQLFRISDNIRFLDRDGRGYWFECYV